MKKVPLGWVLDGSKTGLVVGGGGGFPVGMTGPPFVVTMGVVPIKANPVIRKRRLDRCLRCRIITLVIYIRTGGRFIPIRIICSLASDNPRNPNAELQFVFKTILSCML